MPANAKRPSPAEELTRHHVNDPSRVISLGEFRERRAEHADPLTLQDVLREWADVLRGPWSPDDLARIRLRGALQATADVLDGEYDRWPGDGA